MLVASPWTSTTCGGRSAATNSLVCGKSACAEKEIASTDIPQRHLQDVRLGVDNRRHPMHAVVSIP